VPSSDYITVPYITSVLASLRPKSVLDVGVGTGKFGFLVRDVCDWSRCSSEGPTVLARDQWTTAIDGIEICEDYITSVQRTLYDRILIGPAQAIVDNLGTYYREQCSLDTRYGRKAVFRQLDRRNVSKVPRSP
jgi:hypothetical protein